MTDPLPSSSSVSSTTDGIYPIIKISSADIPFLPLIVYGKVDWANEKDAARVNQMGYGWVEGGFSFSLSVSRAFNEEGSDAIWEEAKGSVGRQADRREGRDVAEVPQG